MVIGEGPAGSWSCSASTAFLRMQTISTCTTRRSVGVAGSSVEHVRGRGLASHGHRFVEDLQACHRDSVPNEGYRCQDQRLASAPRERRQAAGQRAGSPPQAIRVAPSTPNGTTRLSPKGSAEFWSPAGRYDGGSGDRRFLDTTTAEFPAREESPRTLDFRYPAWARSRRRSSFWPSASASKRARGEDFRSVK